MDLGWIATVASWTYLGVVIALVIAAMLRKREPSAALAWSLAIVFLPVVGPVFFVLFGINRIPRRLSRKIAHREAFEARSEWPSGFPHEAALSHVDGRWGSLSRMIETIGEAPRRGGNEVTLFSEGIHAAEAVAQAISEATHHIHVEFYIIRDDGTGRRLLDGLVEKIREGVEVRLIMDGIGSAASVRLLRKLQKSGGEAASFLPILSLKRVSPNLRNHRKIIICDGKVGFFGGMNVGEEYLGRFGRRRRDWYDLHMRVQGPAVWDLQRIFIEDWDYSTGRFLEGDSYFPRSPPPGSTPMQVISGGPDVEVNPIRQAFFGAFTRARRSIHIATPYLVPDLALREALKAAAMSGVEIHVVTQSRPPDRWLAYFCGQYYAEELLQAGVHVYSYTPGMMHAKAMAVDGDWALMGTANLDNRSMFLNFEQMALFDRREEVALIEEQLRTVVSRSTRIGLEDLEDRPGWERLLSAGSRLFAPLL